MICASMGYASILLVIGFSFPPFLIAVVPLNHPDTLDRLCCFSRIRLIVNNLYYLPSADINCWLAIRLEFVGAVLSITAALAISAIVTSSVDVGLVGLVLWWLSLHSKLATKQPQNWFVHSTSEVEQNVVGAESIVHNVKHLEPEASYEIPGDKPTSEWPTAGEVKFCLGLIYQLFHKCTLTLDAPETVYKSHIVCSKGKERKLAAKCVMPENTKLAQLQALTKSLLGQQLPNIIKDHPEPYALQYLLKQLERGLRNVLNLQILNLLQCYILSMLVPSTRSVAEMERSLITLKDLLKKGAAIEHYLAEEKEEGEEGEGGVKEEEEEEAVAARDPTGVVQ
ncbi:hypothetical protein BDR03DRAFT_1037707 [Suillus americanus]|nr:hypothetical protein BDR03DRAFT_1037707 [Suillus americanus]